MMGRGSLHPDWLVPDWPAPAGVRAVFTSRAGGVSAVPFDAMNLGSHVGDLPLSVATNRHRLTQATGCAHAAFLNQVHGVRVERLGPATPDGQCADACITAHRRLACTVMVADCLPVLLTTLAGDRVAAAHAGWRGLAGSPESKGFGIIESVHASFSAAPYGPGREVTDIMAWLGPCIGPAAFEVGEEMKAAFQAHQPQAAACFVATGPGKYLANLPGLARLRLQALGVTQVYGNDGSAAWCTVGNPSRFFSHRRDAGVSGNGFATTGRMAACIWLDG